MPIQKVKHSCFNTVLLLTLSKISRDSQPQWNWGGMKMLVPWLKKDLVAHTLVLKQKFQFCLVLARSELSNGQHWRCYAWTEDKRQSICQWDTYFNTDYVFNTVLSFSQSNPCIRFIWTSFIHHKTFLEYWHIQKFGSKSMKNVHYEYQGRNEQKAESNNRTWIKLAQDYANWWVFTVVVLTLSSTTSVKLIGTDPAPSMLWRVSPRLI